MSAAAAVVVPDEPPVLTRRRLLVSGGLAAAGLASLALLLPQLADLPAMSERVAGGDHGWLALAFAFNAAALAGYVLLFRAVSVDGGESGRRLGLRESALIMLAGNAASRLFASAGAGGVVLTAWALRRSGMQRDQVAVRMTTFLVLMYAVYMGALVIGGVGLWLGLLPGSAPLAMTLVPAGFGAAVIAGAALLPRLRPGMLGDGVRAAVAMAWPGLGGALLYWGFSVAVLWACFHAFGEPPPAAVLAVAFFVGMLANTLPLPGGVGGVDGGMIGALVVFGVDAELSVLAVLAYRGFAFWLPILPGVAAYFALRRVVARWESPHIGELPRVEARPQPASPLLAA